MRKQIGFVYRSEDEQEISLYRQVFSKKGYREIRDRKELYLCDAVLFLCREDLFFDPDCRKALDTCLRRDIPVILAKAGSLPAGYEDILNNAYDASKISFDELERDLYPPKKKTKPEDSQLISRIFAFVLFFLVLAGIALIAILSPAGENSTAQDMQETILKRYENTCVQVWAIGSFDDAVYRGSGFAVSTDGYIVTNAHVIDHPSSRYKIVIKDRAYAAEVEAVYAEKDLALLKTDEHLSDILRFNSEDIKKGTDIYTIGYPENDGLTLINGAYEGTRVTFDSGITYEVISCRLKKGCSGSPVMTHDGSVIGIASAVSTDDEDTGLIIPADICIAFLQEYIFIP